MHEISFNEKLMKYLLKDLKNIYGITDDILVVDYDSDCKDHDKMLLKVHKYGDR